MSRTYAQKILVFCTFSVRNFVSIKHIDKSVCFVYNIMALEKRAFYGGIAQLARALGSYPNGRWFKSDFRYQYGSLVKRLRHRPFTAVTRVRFPYESPIRNPITTAKSLWLWDFSLSDLLQTFLSKWHLTHCFQVMCATFCGTFRVKYFLDKKQESACVSRRAAPSFFYLSLSTSGGAKFSIASRRRG